MQYRKTFMEEINSRYAEIFLGIECEIQTFFWNKKKILKLYIENIINANHI